MLVLGHVARMLSTTFTNPVALAASVVAMITRFMTVSADALATEIRPPAGAASITTVAPLRCCRKGHCVGLQRIEAPAAASQFMDVPITTFLPVGKSLATQIKALAQWSRKKEMLLLKDGALRHNSGECM